MNEYPFYERVLEKVAKFSEDFLTLEQFGSLPYWVRSGASKIFWGYHALVLLLVIIEGPLGFRGLGVAEVAGAILIPFWAVYIGNFVFVYLPFNGMYSLYSYLTDKGITPIHAILISFTSVVGSIALLLLVIGK